MDNYQNNKRIQKEEVRLQSRFTKL
jgi:hypothetical protein